MGAAPWWIWLLAPLFSAPWIAAAIWVYLLGPRSGGEEPPSYAEMASRRLWTR